MTSRSKPNYLFGLLFLFAVTISCEQTPSPNPTFSNEFQRYHNLAFKHHHTNSDSVLYYTDLLQKIAVTSGGHQSNKIIFFLQSSAQRYKGNLQQAMKHCSKARNDIIWERPDTLDGEIMFLSAQLYTDIGQYDNAIAEYQDAIKLFKSLGQIQGEGKCLNSIALIYYRIDDLKRAEIYNDKASLIWEKFPYPLGIASSLTNNGYIQAHKKEFDIAVEYLKKAQDVYQQINDRERYANSFLNIGEVYLKQGNFDGAEQAFKKSLEISRYLNYKQIYVDGLNKLGQCYTKQKKYQLAATTLMDGLVEAEVIKDRALLSEFYKHFSDLYQVTGNYQQAFDFQKKHESQRDSIFQSERALRMAEFEVKYQMDEVTQQNKILRGKNRQRLILLSFISALCVLIILFALVLYSRYLIKLKYLKQGKSLNETLIREQKLENEKLETEARLHEEENRKLQLEIDHKRKELSSVTLHLYQKNESLQHLMEEITRLEERNKDDRNSHLQQLKKSIHRNLNLDEDWERFQLHFDQVHHGFIEKLNQDFPGLSQQDLRHCAYIRINLSTKEISRLMNINPTSVQKSRVRLKKKLGLSKDIDLFDFILKI